MKLLLLLACLTLAGACVAPPPEDAYPPNGFFQSCTTDADCHAGYRCLLWQGLGGPTGTVCTVTCVRNSDCPTVYTDHCGAMQSCNAGVCGYGGCR